jgi:hypothetical protein
VRCRPVAHSSHRAVRFGASPSVRLVEEVFGPRPLREPRRAGASALPARSARAACGGRVKIWRPRVRGRKLEDATMRPRPRRASLGLPPGIGGKCPRTAPPLKGDRPSKGTEGIRAGLIPSVPFFRWSLFPLSPFSARTAPLRRCTWPKPHARTTEPSPKRRLRGRGLPARLAQKGV